MSKELWTKGYEDEIHRLKMDLLFCRESYKDLLALIEKRDRQIEVLERKLKKAQQTIKRTEEIKR
jgi:hypothetical protein